MHTYNLSEELSYNPNAFWIYRLNAFALQYIFCFFNTYTKVMLRTITGYIEYVYIY